MHFPLQRRCLIIIHIPLPPPCKWGSKTGMEGDLTRIESRRSRYGQRCTRKQLQMSPLVPVLVCRSGSCVRVLVVSLCFACTLLPAPVSPLLQPCGFLVVPVVVPQFIPHSPSASFFQYFPVCPCSTNSSLNFLLVSCFSTCPLNQLFWEGFGSHSLGHFSLLFQ